VSDDDYYTAERRRKALWVLDTAGMAKSGYAPLKATLAEWVVEMADEVERLRAVADAAHALPVCPFCEVYRNDPHADDCPLARLDQKEQT
jgi:hypothetical protein